MPEMYDDLWTAAKGMYKLEPAVADGGEIVIYAPHITEVSYTHGRDHRRDRVSLPRLLPRRSGSGSPALPGRRAGALDAREGARPLRRGDGRRDAAHQGDAGDRHSRGAVPPHQPRLPGSGARQTGGVDRARSTKASWSCRVPEKCSTGCGTSRRRASGARRTTSPARSTNMSCDIGVVGLGVMGSNLALNMERNGFRVAGYDLDAAKAQAFAERCRQRARTSIWPRSPGGLDGDAREAAPRADDGAGRRGGRQRHRASQGRTSSRATS